MNNKTPEILSLRQDIECKLERKIRTPNDFDYLSSMIWYRLHENLSPTTLKRLWGYIDGADSARRTTLCILSRFLGYADWEEYLAALEQRTDLESNTFNADGIRAENLREGNLVEVTWLPNRRCVFRYESGVHFTVIETVNSKLCAGDTFDAACFLVGQPMYLDNLVRDDNEPISYVAGSRSGLVSVKIIE